MSRLNVNNINLLDENKILQSTNTKLLIDGKKYIGEFKDEYINSKIY